MKQIILIFSIIIILVKESGQNQEIITANEFNWDLIDTFTNSEGFGHRVSVSGGFLVVGNFLKNKTFVYKYNGSNFVYQQNFSGPPNSNFGFSISVYEDVIVIGAYKINQTFVYRYNGSYWNLEKNLTQTSGNFGISVGIYGNVIVVGTQYENKTYIYRYNAGDWGLEQTIYEPLVNNSGYLVSIYDDVIVIGSLWDNRILVYRYNGVAWNLEQTLYSLTTCSQGYSISIYNNVIAIAATSGNSLLIYRYNDIAWNLEQTLQTAPFPEWSGYGVDIYTNVMVVGDSYSNQTLIYAYNGTYWNNEKNITESYPFFGASVAISNNFTAVGSPITNDVFVYRMNNNEKIVVLNCSSLFSSFECFWEFDFFILNFQIDYGFGWIHIDSPILNGSTYYQLFNSSQYPNITGNHAYSIQIKGCDDTETICGEPSSIINLVTRIDAVKNFQLTNLTDYLVNTSWGYPTVDLIGGIPNLDHYIISYFPQSDPGSVTLISVPNYLTSYLLDIQCGNDYNISIYACRNSACQGDDQGEVVESSISLGLEAVSDLSCSVSDVFDILCDWNPPINCSTPSYYNFTFQAISKDDSGNYNVTSLNQNFTSQFQNQEYQVYVSACNSDNVCAEITTTSVKTDNLSAPTITQSIPKIEEIELHFSKVIGAQNYSISIDNKVTWQNFTTLNLDGSEAIGTINGIPGNVDQQIAIRGCSDLNCNNIYIGEPSSTIIAKAILGNITSLNCTPSSCGFECNWDSLSLSTGLEGYSLTYNSTQICLSKSTTTLVVLGLIPEAFYQISVHSSATSDCSYDQYSGIDSTTSITTENLLAPNIIQSIPKIEEIELYFSKVIGAQNYLISLDNKVNWQKFTTLNLEGSQEIGTINGIPGNVDQQIAVRGCSDLNCEVGHLGLSSSTITAKAILGNITSLNCYGIICGFYCNWSPLFLSSGLQRYSLTYNSMPICVENSLTTYTVTGLKGNEVYEISLLASATNDCSYDQYSGLPKITSVTTFSSSDSSSASASSTWIILIVCLILAILLISAIVLFIVFRKRRKRRKNTKKLKKPKKEKELENEFDFVYYDADNPDDGFEEF
ncbi:hypothetical protein M0811_10505 [Anaeramoeba ignava]|uniref:Fibronectin type-III domain-containing protein n=1 Tax=Anaeramoeba ignava TaxID=1746090 RepID=A0A9Q0R9B7_ANAIG|nr:hypothetical protein M0811_10505 [Anaeramoeba ignava]